MWVIMQVTPFAWGEFYFPLFSRALDKTARISNMEVLANSSAPMQSSFNPYQNNEGYVEWHPQVPPFGLLRYIYCAAATCTV
jgi:hypothetical protein